MRGVGGGRDGGKSGGGLPPSALCGVIQAGDLPSLKRAIAADDSAVNAPQGPWARTLLMEASGAGQAPCAALLLSQGAQVAKVDADGSTALHLASAAGHDPVVHILLYYNVDVFLLDGWGNSPLALAAAHGHAPVVRRLLLRIQQLTLPPPVKRPRLAVAFGGGEVVSPGSLGGGSPAGDEEDADTGPVDACNNFGRTPLWRAACGGHAEVVGLLLKAGADPTLEDDQGCDARAIALDRGHGAVVALIDNWMAAAPAHGRGGGNGDGNDNAAGLPTVSPYSTSSDGRGQQRQPPMPAHVVIPSPAMT